MDAFLLSVVSVGAIAVIILDAAGSYASTKFGFRYTKLLPGSFFIYACVGALAAHDGSVGTGAVAAGLVASVDATIGWAISWYIGPGRIPDASPQKIAKIALLVTGYGALCGGIVAALVLMF